MKRPTHGGYFYRAGRDIFQSVCDEIAFGTVIRCVLYYFLLKNTFQCTYSSYTILLLIVFYTLVCCTETACIPPARRSKSPSAAGLLPYRILEGSAW